MHGAGEAGYRHTKAKVEPGEKLELIPLRKDRYFLIPASKKVAQQYVSTLLMILLAASRVREEKKSYLFSCTLNLFTFLNFWYNIMFSITASRLAYGVPDLMGSRTDATTNGNTST